MICTASYDGVLSRVRISATAVTGSLADVDRSVDQINWTRVRGATAAPVVSGALAPPVDDYEFATTDGLPQGGACPPGAAGVTNYYRVTAYEPESVLEVTGGPSSCATTPDDATLDITGDIDLQIGIRPASWTPPTDYNLLAKTATVNQSSWVLQLHRSGVLNLKWSTDGTDASFFTNDVKSTSAVGALSGEHRALRATLDVNNGSGGHTVTFYTAARLGDSWKRLGDPVVRTGVTSIFSGTSLVKVAESRPDFSGLAVPLDGDVTRAVIVSGIDGTVRASPDFTAQPPGTSVFNDAQGRTWTVCPQARIVADPDPPETPTTTDTCVTSIAPDIGGVWLKSIYRPFLNRRISVLRAFDDVTRPSRGGVFDVVGRSLPVAVSDVRGSRRWTLGICVTGAGEASDVDLMLAGGDPLFLHVPNNSNLPVPSMHVAVEETSARKVAWSDRRTLQLPLVEIAAPGADVVGAVGTWQTVLNTYATWQAVLNAHPTWQDLLELVGDESEVFVP